MHPSSIHIPTHLTRARAMAAGLLLATCAVAAEPAAPEADAQQEEALYITFDDIGQMAEVERVTIDPLDENPELSKTDPYVLEEQTFKYETGVSVTASTTHIQWEGEERPAAIMDGDMKTRWSSAYADDQRVTVDLGKMQDVAVLRLHWETAAPADYTVATSDDGRMWATVHTSKDGKLGPRIDDIPLNAKTRWIRLNLQKRSSEWGFSLWELETLTPAALKAETDAAAAAAAQAEAAKAPAVPTETTAAD